MLKFLENQKFSELNDEEKREFNEYAKTYFDKASERESESINDLVKYLWIANSSAATASIAIIQAKGVTDFFQIWGTSSFILGIIFLLALKFVSEILHSLHRYKFEDYINKVHADICSIDAILKVLKIKKINTEALLLQDVADEEYQKEEEQKEEAQKEDYFQPQNVNCAQQ